MSEKFTNTGFMKALLFPAPNYEGTSKFINAPFQVTCPTRGMDKFWKVQQGRV